MRRNKINRLIATVLVAIMLLGVLPLQAAAEAVTSIGTTSIQNEFIKVSVDNTTGRFSVRTVDGQPIRKLDNGVDLMFGGDNPESSFTTFKINGTDLIFGNPYKFGVNWFSEVTPPEIVKGTDGTESLVTVWSIQGIRISQVITLLQREDKEQAGNVRIQYQVLNTTDATVEVGSRVLLDTSVGGNDGPAFQLGQNYGAPITVERKLVHEPETLGFNPAVDEQAYNLHKLPAYWVMRDKLDPTNPLATNVIAYGFNNLFEGGINVVDEMIVGHWSGLAATKWDYSPNSNLDYTLDTNDYGTADTAVAYYWTPDVVPAGGSNSYELVYGLGEIISPDKVFDVRFLDPTQKLETNADETDYSNDGIFEVNVEIENLEMFDMEHSSIDVTLKLENGLQLVDENGNVLGNGSQKLTFRKEVSPEEAAQGIEVIPYKPGEVVAAKWRVKASGKPWPTTRQYLVTVSSPETEKKLEAKLEDSQGMPESEIRAIYESSRSSFIFLPPIGELRETLVYSMSPEEAYFSDDKFITLNISNIAAYDVGNAAQSSSANFDLYLKNIKSGERYRIPVSRSVSVQPLGNGFAGDLKIVYSGGEKVAADGTTLEVLDNSELPLGEYAVEVDFRDKSVPELAEALSFTTEQIFAVSGNEENRVRKAGILAVYKTKLDLTSNGAQDKALFAEMLPWAYGGLSDTQFTAKRDADRGILSTAKAELVTKSRWLDPQLNMSDALDLAEIPVYGVETFVDEEEFEAFADGLSSEDGQEIVLEVRGQIVQSGTGANAQYLIRSDTEPAILNKSVAYHGKDMTLSFGKFPLAERLSANTDTPLLQSLFAGGEGTLSIANSGFVFHQGEWTVDFYNGFEKTLGEESTLSEEEQEWETARNGEDTSLNGNLQWANGLIGDAINPYRNLLVSYVYFNRQSLFSAPSFAIDGFGLRLNDFVLRKDGVSFGGEIKLRILNGEVSNVIFNQSGFVGIESSLKFKLDNSVGLFKPGSDDKVEGSIDVTHYKDPDKFGVYNKYGISFEASLENMFTISAELGFRRVPDGRILPDVIAFGGDLPGDGIAINPATKITSLRGAIRELAMTIAGGTERLPLTLEAGIDMQFGVKPAVFTGNVDLTLKATGIKVVGKLGFGEGSKVIPMLTEALVQTQWVSPMFIRAKASVDVGGWDIIVGNGSLFIGENLEKRRIDFEGMINSRLQVPSSVPVVGGMGFGVRAGANNDKMWAGISLLFVSLGITYYWGGGIAFSTDGVTGDGEALAYLVVHDPEEGPRLLEIGTGVNVLATSWENEENEIQEIRYTAVGEGVDLIEGGSQNLGIGGIRTSDGGKTHVIPMDKVSGDALLEVEYFTTTRPNLTLTRGDGSTYNVVFGEVTDTTATAFEQIIPAAKEGDLKADGTTVTRKEALESTDVRRAYIAIPHDEALNGDWKLISSQPVKSKLINLPVMPKLTEAALVKDEQDADKFKARWTVEQASAGDHISLYLATDRVSDQPNPDEANDPGLLIASDIEIGSGDIGADGSASGEMSFDVKQIAQLGGADIRGMLQQGSYYLRAELKNDIAFSAKSSEEAFELIDPLAPASVGSVGTKVIGNGLFEVSFPSVAKKDGEEGDEFSYILTATDEEGYLYEPFGEEAYSETDLNGRLSGGSYRVSIGGWNALGKPKLDANGALLRNADGSIAMEEGEVRYAGLEPGKTYRVGVTVAKAQSGDESGNLRFSGTVYSAGKLLPVASPPALVVDEKPVVNGKYEILSSAGRVEVAVAADKPGVSLEASTEDGSLGVYDLDSTDTIALDFDADGVYAVELKARDKATGDTSVAILYVTVDTIAPMIYLDSPSPGERASGGRVTVEGTTMSDASITISDADTGRQLASLKPDEEGRFQREVPIDAAKAKTRLRIETVDAAGNGNSAVVEVLNGDAKLPRKLAISVPELIEAGGEAVALEGYVEYTDGSRELLEGSQLSFNLVMGEANASLEQNGEITGLRKGAAIVEASYEAWEGLTLTASDVVEVVAPAEGAAPPDVMDSIKAATAGTGWAGESRVIVSSPGHDGNMTGSELAYRIYAVKDQAALPTFEQDITAWEKLPDNGIVKAKDGEWIVIAKRTTGERKLTTASSAAIRIYEFVSQNPVSLPGDNRVKIGDVVIDSTKGGKNIALPLELDGVSKQGLLTGDVTPGEKGATVTVTPERKALLDSVKQGQQIRLGVSGPIEGLNFKLDAALLKQLAEREVSLALESGLGSYRLNLSAIDLAALTAQFPNSAPENLTVTLNVGLADQAFTTHAEALRKNGIEPVGSPVSFNVTATAGGKTVYVDKLKSFTVKELPLPLGKDDRNVSTVVVLEADGTVRHVPTSFDVREGRFYAVASSITNSVYLAVNHVSNFSDMQGHWANETVSDLASRLVLNGVSPGKFEPSRSMNRAELAALMVRALGLKSSGGATVSFSDVSPGDWYYDAVQTAVEYGLMSGYGGNRFGPRDAMTREQAMVMAIRALELGGWSASAEGGNALSGFTDSGELSGWARSSAAQAVKLGIITGKSATELAPKANVSRAEMAAIVRRLLLQLKVIQ
ncbi:S-layer homology domain-containing protein [Paenibacillus sp. CAU 1782]